MNKVSQPLIRVSKRMEINKKHKILLTVGAILAAILLSGILIACLGYNPFKFYAKVVSGPFSSLLYLRVLVRTIVPLLVTSIGITLAFKMRFWNIGAEGQFIIGAFTAFTFGILIGDKLPSFIAIVIILLMGMIGAGIYGVFVAVLKVKFNTNETLMTLMLNYVALYFVTYFINNNVPFYVQSGNGIPTFKILDKNVWLSEITMGKFSMDTSVFIALILVVMVFIYFRYTKQGFQINVVGDSPSTAKYAGMKVGKIVIRTMFLSAAVVGLAGAMQILGGSTGHTMSINITNGVGWTGIIIAWLAKLNPIAILIATVLMSILECGTSIARTALGISDSVADIIQGIILFSIIAFDFFINYKVTFRKRKEKSIASVSVDENLQEESKEMLELAVDNQEDIQIIDMPIEENTVEEINVIQVAENVESKETVADDISKPKRTPKPKTAATSKKVSKPKTVKKPAASKEGGKE